MKTGLCAAKQEGRESVRMHLCKCLSEGTHSQACWQTWQLISYLDMFLLPYACICVSAYLKVLTRKFVGRHGNLFSYLDMFFLVVSFNYHVPGIIKILARVQHFRHGF